MATTGGTPGIANTCPTGEVTEVRYAKCKSGEWRGDIREDILLGGDRRMLRECICDNGRDRGTLCDA